MLAKYGGSICFVAYLRALDEWKHICCGTERKIEPPPVWLCDGEYARENRIENPKPPVKLFAPAPAMRRKKVAQLGLSLEVR